MIVVSATWQVQGKIERRSGSLETRWRWLSRASAVNKWRANGEGDGVGRRSCSRGGGHPCSPEEKGSASAIHGNCKVLFEGLNLKLGVL